MDVNKMYDYMIEYGIVQEETLNCITDINGFNIDVLNDVLYWATGYRNMEQYLEYEEVKRDD